MSYRFHDVPVKDRQTGEALHYRAYTATVAEARSFARMTFKDQRLWDIQDDEEIREHGHHAGPLTTPPLPPRVATAPVPKTCKWCKSRPGGCLYCK